MGWYAKHIFARVMEWSLDVPEIAEQRRRTLAPVAGEVLEIGFGTGLNLPHYPDGVTRLTVIDSERMLPARVGGRIATARMPVRPMQLDATGRLPFPDQSFDAVVTSLTLCSLADPHPALREMRRVLKPGGRYAFFEHGRSDDPVVAHRQDRFNPVQKLIACGCHLNRPIDRLIRDAGLLIVALDRFALPGSPRILAEMYRGVAQG
jgi:ubiquinone/menaquinone biosynthesis C-methylase UbiE